MLVSSLWDQAEASLQQSPHLWSVRFSCLALFLLLPFPNRTPSTSHYHKNPYLSLGFWYPTLKRLPRWHGSTVGEPQLEDFALNAAQSRLDFQCTHVSEGKTCGANTSTSGGIMSLFWLIECYRWTLIAGFSRSSSWTHEPIWLSYTLCLCFCLCVSLHPLQTSYLFFFSALSLLFYNLSIRCLLDPAWAWLLRLPGLPHGCSLLHQLQLYFQPSFLWVCQSQFPRVRIWMANFILGLLGSLCPGYLWVKSAIA